MSKPRDHRIETPGSALEPTPELPPQDFGAPMTAGEVHARDPLREHGSAKHSPEINPAPTPIVTAHPTPAPAPAAPPAPIGIDPVIVDGHVDPTQLKPTERVLTDRGWVVPAEPSQIVDRKHPAHPHNVARRHKG